MIREFIFYIAMELTHVDGLNKISLKESIFNIKLLNGPTLRDVDTENGANGSWFDNKTERVVKVQTRLLRKTLGNNKTFVTIEMPLAIKFVTIQPMTVNNISRDRFRNMIPCVIGKKSRHLIVHGSTSMSVTYGLSSGLMNGRDVGGSS